MKEVSQQRQLSDSPLHDEPNEYGFGTRTGAAGASAFPPVGGEYGEAEQFADAGDENAGRVAANVAHAFLR
jgi:hypothetical protein